MLKKTLGPSPSELYTFEKHWPTIQSILNRLIYDQLVGNDEWQSLFHDVHMICSWDEFGSIKLLSAIEAELLKHIILVVREKLLSIQDGQQQLKEYLDIWLEFKRHCTKFQKAFQQLDLAVDKKRSAVAFLMLKLWRNHVILPIQDRLQEPELLANHSDLLLRRTTLNRKYSPEDINNRLDELISVIRFVKNKDSLIKFHKIHLTRRLLLDITIDIDLEERFLTQLKDMPDIPFEQLSKLNRMIKDIKSSKELLQQYRKSLRPIYNNNNYNNNTIPILTSHVEDLNLQENNDCYDHIDNIDVKILNPSAWPKTNDKVPLSLPDEVIPIMTSLDKLSSFYKKQYPGRTLEWCPQLSTATIVFSTKNGGKFDIDLTTAQLAILSVYNKDDSKMTQTFEELAKGTKQESSELKRTLWSLVSNPRLKSQLIHCEPKLDGIKDLDNTINNYSINHEFVLV